VSCTNGVFLRHLRHWWGEMHENGLFSRVFVMTQESGPCVIGASRWPAVRHEGGEGGYEPTRAAENRQTTISSLDRVAHSPGQFPVL
jgi:hypothetical protein